MSVGEWEFSGEQYALRVALLSGALLPWQRGDWQRGDSSQSESLTLTKMSAPSCPRSSWVKFTQLVVVFLTEIKLHYCWDARKIFWAPNLILSRYLLRVCHLRSGYRLPVLRHFPSLSHGFSSRLWWVRFCSSLPSTHCLCEQAAVKNPTLASVVWLGNG